MGVAASAPDEERREEVEEVLRVDGPVGVVFGGAARPDGFDSLDFFEFMSDFFAQRADFSRVGVTNSADFFESMTCFFSPCG